MLLCSSYSYSEEVFESSVNAAANGLNWTMANILPAQAGLTVNSVFYRYTAIKDPVDPMIVHVQNKDALSEGYIFRSSDDWTGLPGNTISKLVSANGVPLERWGDGSIEVEGFGTVSNPVVRYNYQYDPCFQNTVDPTCPGYIAPVNVVDVALTDPLDDELIQAELEKEPPKKDEDEERRAFVDAQKQKLEKALGGINSALITAQAESAAALFFAMNPVPVAYTLSLPGGSYEETIQYSSKQLQDNSKARRASFAQQLLHEEMVQSQYRGAPAQEND